MNIARKRLFISNTISGWKPTFWLRDEFLADDSAPPTNPRSAEPGPGTLTFYGTDISTSSISSGILNLIRTDVYKPLLYGPLTSRVVGRALVIRSQTTGYQSSFIGWNTATSYYPSTLGIWNYQGGSEAWAEPGHLSCGIPVQTGFFIVYAIMRSSGGFVVIKTSSQTILVYVSNYHSGSLYPGVSAGNGADNNTLVEYVRGVDLPAPWNTDYGIGTQRVENPIAGEIVQSMTDALVEFTMIAQLGITQVLMFRRTDDDNTWKLECDQTVGTIKLFKRISGIDTELNTGKTQTWVAGNSYRIVVMFESGKIRTYVDNVNKHSVTNDTYNSSATGVKVSHAGNNLVCYPRFITGAALNVLNSIS